MAPGGKQENWLVDWIQKQFGPKRKPKFVDQGSGDAPADLFRDINALRTPEVDPYDKDAVEKAKYTDGPLGQIATSKVFEFSTLGMICFNALMIGVDTDYNARIGKPENLWEGPIGFIIIENMFCGYFTIEVLIRFFAYKKKTDSLCDAWFIFDSALVSMMIAETWVMPFIGAGGPGFLGVFRLLRLLRITRISRIMRAVPEMMVIVKGMLAATRTVACTGFLMVVVLYIFSIIFTDAYHEDPNLAEDDEDFDAKIEAQATFGTLGKSMFSLFIMGTILDDYTACTTVILATKQRDTMMFWFILCTLISSFMMLNMLVGTIFEVVSATKEGESVLAVENNLREAIATIFQKMDKDSNQVISRGEFLEMRNNKLVREALKSLDIEDEHFDLYAELFFKTEESEGVMPSLSYDKLVSMILRLKPGGFVSALDFAAFGKRINSIHDRVKERCVQLEGLCLSLQAKQDSDSLPPLPVPPLPLPDGGPPPPPENAASHRTALSESDRERLAQIHRMEIIEELQRRLGVESLEKSGVPASAPEDIQMASRPAGTDIQIASRPADTQRGQQALTAPGVPGIMYDDETVYV